MRYASYHINHINNAASPTRGARSAVTPLVGLTLVYLALRVVRSYPNLEDPYICTTSHKQRTVCWCIASSHMCFAVAAG